MRHALGASALTPRPPAALQALLITLAATVVAVIAAEYLLPLLLDGVPGVIWVISQRSGRIVVGPTAIVFASSLAAIVAVISGAWPAVATSRAPDDAIRKASAAKGSSAGHVGSAVLVAAASLMWSCSSREPARPCARWWISIARQRATTLRVTVAQIYLPTGRYTTWPERVALRAAACRGCA